MPYALKQFLKNKLAIFGLVMIVLFSVAAIFAPFIAPNPPDKQFFDGLTLEGAPLAPNKTFWLGTDLLGRSLFSRLLFGARTSLIIGIAANGAAIFIGAFLGILAGYAKGFIGTVIMRFTDLMMAFPALLLAIALAAIFNPQPVDRRTGDCTGELGSDRTGNLQPDHGTHRPGIHRSRPCRGRRLAQNPGYSHCTPSLADPARLGHPGYRHDGFARSHPVIFGCWRQAANALMGRNYLREPVLLPGCTLARFFPGSGHYASLAII